MTRTVFLDRDGTLNREQGFVTKPQELEVLPGAADAVRRLHDAGFRIVVVTNQSGIARGLYTESDLAAIHDVLHERLLRLPTAYLHCPHHPEGSFGYGGACVCRKPAAGLLFQAKELLGVAFEGGALVGDSARDLLMARGLPLRTIHVRSGKPVQHERAVLAHEGLSVDHEAADLAGAVDWLLASR